VRTRVQTPVLPKEEEREGEENRQTMRGLSQPGLSVQMDGKKELSAIK
jgi:hypothetical protein